MVQFPDELLFEHFDTAAELVLLVLDRITKESIEERGLLAPDLPENTLDLLAPQRFPHLPSSIDSTHELFFDFL